MKIKVTSPKYGKHTILIDKEDSKLFDKNKIYLHHVGNFLYVRINPLKIYLHRLIMKPDKGFVVDHKNRNTLDNRKENLNVCTVQENLRNQKRSNNKTGYTGISNYMDGKYRAQIKHNYKKIHLGVFEKIEDAINARKKAEKELGW